MSDSNSLVRRKNLFTHLPFSEVTEIALTYLYSGGHAQDIENLILKFRLKLTLMNVHFKLNIKLYCHVDNRICTKQSTCNCSIKLMQCLETLNLHLKRDRYKLGIGLSGHEYMC